MLMLGIDFPREGDEKKISNSENVCNMWAISEMYDTELAKNRIIMKLTSLLNESSVWSGPRSVDNWEKYRGYSVIIIISFCLYYAT